MENKKVAIIISIYKNDNIDFIKTSLESLLNQTYPNDIFLCIDGYIDYDVKSYIEKISHDDSIYILENENNIGLASSLNKLIDVVVDLDYDYIARMDADDISLENRLELQVDFLDNNKNIDVIGSGCSEFGASYALNEKILPIKHVDLEEYSITRCPFIHPTVMFRSVVFKKGFRYPENTKMTEDMALWFILLENKFQFHNLPIVLLKYRMHEDTVKRRQGLGKAISEFSIRMYYMKKLNRVSFKNISFIFARLFFHMLPIFILKLMYKIRK